MSKISDARLFFLLPAIVLATSGCGDKITNHGDNFDVSGGWAWDGFLVGQGIVCPVFGTLQLSQSGDQVSGTYMMGPAACILPDLSLFELNWGSGQITNGSCTGNSVQAEIRLDFGSDWTNTGGTVFAVAPNGITAGTSTVLIDFGGAIGPVTMNGSWSAVR